MNTEFVILHDFAVKSAKYGQKDANSPKFQYEISFNVMDGMLSFLQYDINNRFLIVLL